ncbi:hypothetical protein HanIR_Chr06g0265911 [Helianthus annuus]|nr:hypothetical protein HanIR_Chr06g0265911 [Helianthus annuus]
MTWTLVGASNTAPRGVQEGAMAGWVKQMTSVREGWVVCHASFNQSCFFCVFYLFEINVWWDSENL